jgi:hypothetical protein
MNPLTEDLACSDTVEVSDAVELDSFPIEDEWLARYVSSTVARCVGHPEVIGVSAFDGRVTLRGSVAPGEVVRLITEVSALPEVRGLHNQLEVHAVE